VKFTVHFIDADTIGTFLVEMASLDLMPHSVNTFLKQVQLKLWDNTVFWHHDGVDHIISAAPVQYTRGDTRHHYFQALGVRELGFAEYSPEYPHEPFTVGFAGRGPGFYINTVDNTQIHGPGGQSNNSTDEADPCFGKVVEGMDTVLDMYKLQQRQSSEAEKKKSWHDDELTKIVTVEILK
jgi:cyclophilin family peptidyl-prolyl cis-trans isomerase